MRDEIEVLSDYVRSESGYKGNLNPEADLLEAKILDSFSVVQLVMFIQERFKVEFEAEDLTRASLATLSNIVALIDKRKATAGKGCCMRAIPLARPGTQERRFEKHNRR